MEGEGESNSHWRDSGGGLAKGCGRPDLWQRVVSVDELRGRPSLTIRGDKQAVDGRLDQTVRWCATGERVGCQVARLTRIWGAQGTFGRL